jgi:hypothetical protein
VHGFCDGITIGSDDDASRFAHIRITAVSAHDNGDSGVLTYDQADSAHAIRDVTVTDTRAYRNAGDGGIVLFGVDRGSVERSVAYANGAHNQGGVGIWAFDAEHILLAHDESYRNLTTGSDGDGFDLDGGVSDSAMEYDYSHGNAGVGFLVCPCLPSYRMQNDVVRFDVSVGDGLSRITQPSGIFVDGGAPFSGLQIISNTAYSAAGRGPLVQINDNYVPFAHIHVRDNVFVTGGAKPLLRVDQTHLTDVRFQGNDWWSTSGSFRVRWARLTFTTLGAWRARTGAETRAGRPVGLSADPDLCELGWDGVLWPHALAALTAYRPLPGSPALPGRLGALALVRRCRAGAKG